MKNKLKILRNRICKNITKVFNFFGIGTGFNVWRGYIISFNETMIEFRLQKDYNLDYYGKMPRELLTDEQNKMVCMGLIIKINIFKGKVKFLKEDLKWC